MSDTGTPHTIFALSSGRGRAGVAVVRVSGPASREAIGKLAGDVPAARVANVRRLRDPETGEPLDEALVVFFQAPTSFTGEDIAEFHIHGSLAVIEGVLDALAGIDGMRPAAPGEFARRAFANEKIDLTQAEGLADLIEAETRAQRRQALGQAGGVLKALCAKWREDIIKAASMVEAAIDFSDEADVPELVERQARPVISALARDISAQLDDARRGERLRDGLRVVLAGPPNAGKSSLLNALSQRDVAIVSEEPGTTRDIIEVHLDLGGFPVTLVDTAGLREAKGAVEQEGIRRTLMRAGEADLLLWLVNAMDPVWTIPDEIEGGARAQLVLVNKTDVMSPEAPSGVEAVAISARTGAGIDGLLGELLRQAGALFDSGEPAVVTRARQRRELQDCVSALDAFLTGDALDLELRAEDLRAAAASLGRVTGAVDVEEVLDRIFGDFCIGK